MDNRLARILAFERALAGRRSTRLIPKPYGAVVLNDDLPIVHDLNRLLAERGPVEAERLIEDATTLIASIDRHARVDVADASLADDLASGFVTQGWVRSDWLLMARDVAGERVDPAIREVDPEIVFSFSDQTALLEYDAETSRQLGARTRLTFDAMRARGFARFVDEEPVTMCRLYIDGATACIDSLDTLDEHQGRGYGRAALTAAIAAAAGEGVDLVFLVVEPDNPAVRLYERVGFARVGTTVQFDAPS